MAVVRIFSPLPSQSRDLSYLGHTVFDRKSDLSFSTSFSPIRINFCRPCLLRYGTLAILMSREEKGKQRAEAERWSVDEVVGWLREKEFNQDVCHQFASMYLRVFVQHSIYSYA